MLEKYSAADQKQWVEFRAFFIDEYERMLREGQGNTNSKEVYSGMLNDTELDDVKSIVEAITKYEEWAISAESKMRDMESELSQIKLAVKNPHAAFFSPQKQSFQEPTTKIQFPTQPVTYMQRQTPNHNGQGRLTSKPPHKK